MRIWIVTVLLFGGAVASQVTAQDAASKPAAEQESAADTAARQTLEQVCATCHDSGVITGQVRTVADWHDVVDQMVQMGASGTEEQFEQVRQFLARNYSKVDANKAPAAELAAVLDVMPDVGEAIVKFRTANGPFKTLDDLKQVPGIDAAKLDARRTRITF
jgi:competence protein ComEA